MQHDEKKRLASVLRLARQDLEAFVIQAWRTCESFLKNKYPEIVPLTSAKERLEALRNNKLPPRLWHDLNRLRILRNDVEHSDLTPDEGDGDITIGTLKRTAAFLGIESKAMETAPRRDWQAFQNSARSFFEQELGIPLRSEVELLLPDGQTHRFDLASPDSSVIAECKSYTWTSGGNEPAAKLNQAKTDLQFLKATSATRKILIFEDDLHPKNGKSLAELFVRRNRVLREGTEIWRYLHGRFERIWPQGSTSRQ